MMKRHLAALALLLSALLPPAHADTRDPNQHFFHTTLGDYREDFAQARAEGKAGVVFLYEMEECPFCDRLHNRVLNRVEVQEYFQKHFLVFRIDVKGNAPVIDQEGRATTEREMAGRAKVRGTPTTAFHGLDGRELTRYVGPSRDAAEFLLLGRYVVDGDYAKSSFADYRNNQRNTPRNNGSKP